MITFQAEDEIAAICSAIGASYTGALGVTSSSGPGVALKTEAMGLAISTELPLIIVNSQRAGPSTGMPTKTEQSDLFQAVYGRNADSPLAVISAVDAVRLLRGGHRGGADRGGPHDAGDSPHRRIPRQRRRAVAGPGHRRHTRSSRSGSGAKRKASIPSCAIRRRWRAHGRFPGTPGLEHRIGGIEKNYNSGHISYDPDNHAKMTRVRAEKIARIADDIPLQATTLGPEKGKVAVVGWGSTYGPIRAAVARSRAEGIDVSHIHLRYLNPFPRNLGDLLRGFERVLVPEMNNGQLVTILRSTFLLPAEGLSKVTGKPFKVSELVPAIRAAAEL